MLELYQFPISHYCEKVRWALDHKELIYKQKNLVPGLHMAFTKRHCANSSVPVIKHGHRYIQGSSEIISYLDEQFQNDPLTPSNESLKKEAIEWEEYVDKSVGPHVRRVVYHVLLDHPKTVIPLFVAGSPWHSRLYVKTTYSGLTKLMRKGMNINDESAQRSEQKVLDAIDFICEKTKESPHIVGNKLSRADTATAALLAPFAMPQKYGLDWPSELPEPLDSFIKEVSPKLDWVRQTYETYR